MKKNVPILIIILTTLVLIGCTSTTNKISTNKINFDIDVANLNYTLPSHTKLCMPDTKQVCGSEGCKDIKPTVFLAYDENNKMIYRCDNKPCDGYEIKINQSSIYTYIEPTEPRGFTVKISNDNKYTETVSLGLDTFISYGTCR